MLSILLAAALLTQSYAFQCDTTFSQRECGKLQRASASIATLIKTADQVVADAMIHLADETALLYKTMLPLLTRLDFDGAKIKLDNTTTIVVSKGMSIEQFQKFVQKLLAVLKNIKDLKLRGADEFVELVKKIRDEYIKAITFPVSNGYSVITTIADAKAQIEELLKKVGPIVRRIFLAVFSKFDDKLKDLSGYVDKMMVLFPSYNGVWEKIKVIIRSSLDIAKNKVSPVALHKIDAAANAAGADVAAMLDEITQQPTGVKRGITDAWEKVKKAVSNFSDKIKTTTMEIIEKHKPIVIKAVENAKTITIDALKKIVIEVHGAIVKVLVGGKEVTSE